MEKSHIQELRRINYLCSEMQGLYHQADLKLGISDSVSVVLYAAYEGGGQCPLSDVYKNSGVSKQTIHSAVRAMERDGLLRLEPMGGRSKRVVLTEQGQALAEQTAARLLQAEINAFDSWSQEEIECYVRLTEKYTDCFRRQVENL